MDAAQQEQDDFDNQDDPGDPPPLLGLVPFLVLLVLNGNGWHGGCHPMHTKK